MLPPIKIKSRRRLWRVWPGVTLAAIAGVIFSLWGADWVWVRGNGIVAGELTSVSPIVQARLKTRFVKCLDHVKRGQRVAEFVNEATVESAAQQLAALQLQLTQAPDPRPRHRRAGDRQGDGLLPRIVGASLFSYALFLATGKVVSIRSRATGLCQSERRSIE
jgi:multidrug efflux pump subunit AcrA (membrane-fusion protein)